MFNFLNITIFLMNVKLVFIKKKLFTSMNELNQKLALKNDMKKILFSSILPPVNNNNIKYWIRRFFIRKYIKPSLLFCLPYWCSWGERCSGINFLNQDYWVNWSWRILFIFWFTNLHFVLISQAAGLMIDNKIFHIGSHPKSHLPIERN